jgi:hypothetical protein
MKEEPKERLQPEDSLISQLIHEYAELVPLPHAPFGRIIYFKARNLLRFTYFIQGLIMFFPPKAKDKESCILAQERATGTLKKMEDMAHDLLEIDPKKDPSTGDFHLEDLRAVIIDALGGDKQ